MTKTEHCQLNQWDPADQVRRTDFNEDNAKLDAAIKAETDARAAGDAALQTALTAETNARTSAVSAINTTLAEKVQIIAGAYTGDGAARRFINLGRTPKALLLFEASGRTYVETPASIGGLALPGHPTGRMGTNNAAAEIVSNGFQVGSGVGVWSNVNNYVYHYLAFV